MNVCPTLYTVFIYLVLQRSKRGRERDQPPGKNAGEGTGEGLVDGTKGSKDRPGTPPIRYGFIGIPQ